jgi:phosphopantothenoylcysteine decarboxylase/phosphopantothenate--cysteine ligase
MKDTTNNKIVLGVSSSISIYKACELVRAFQKHGFPVQVIMTPNATKLVAPRLFQALTGREVYWDIFSETSVERIAHIDLARDAALLLVAPATGNVIGKMATGIADDFLTTFYMAASCPVVVAPAMHENMYLHSSTQHNIRLLQAAGVRFLPPEKGPLAGGEVGWGRLAPLDEIVAVCLDCLKMSTGLSGKKVLVTAGPTREYLDPVRYLSSRSSGKMGYALAEEAARRGAEVILITGPTALPVLVSGIRVVQVESAEQMASAVEDRRNQADIVIMAAAVADFRPARFREHKTKKQEAAGTVDLDRTPDILDQLGRNKGGRILVGFAAETEDIDANARKKLKKKNLDLIVANDVSQPDTGFGSDFNQVRLLFPDGRSVSTEKMSKLEISRVILDEIEGIIASEKNRRHS